MNYEYEQAVNIRLNNIEKVLTELKDVVVETKLQAKDIVEINGKVNDFVNAINAHEKRIRDLELAPVKTKADKLGLISDIILKAVITVCISIVFVRLGLQ
jgi:hypothetical protein